MTPSIQRSLIEGTLTTLRDGKARKGMAVQTAAIVLNGGKGSVRPGTEPTQQQVQEAISGLEKLLAKLPDLPVEEAFSARALAARANVKFDPKLHPKDRSGKFRETPDAPKAPAKPKAKHIFGDTNDPNTRGKGAEAAARHAQAAAAKSAPKGKDDGDWIDVGDDVEEAAKLLGEGKKVRMNQPREVSTLVSKLAEIVRDAKEKGEKAPDYDLCNVTVKGTNLFCTESKGIPRVEMPQLSGIPTPGSRADSLEKNGKGEVNLGDHFRNMLRERGIGIEDVDEKASYLRASQNQLNGAKVAGMTKVLDDGGVLGGDPRIFVSSDNYVVDGHHRWAANVAHDLQDNVEGDVDMPVSRVDMSIIELLAEANNFAEEWGIPQAAVGQQLPDADKPKPLKFGAVQEGSDDDCGCSGVPLSEHKVRVAGALADRIAEMRDLSEVVADMSPAATGSGTAKPVGEPRRPKAKRGGRASGGTGDEPKGRDGEEKKQPGQAKDKNFEKLHPRGRGGVWIKKNEGMQGQPSQPVAQAQRRLAQLGFAPGAPDGRNGPLTQAAITRFQAAYGLRQTGEIDPATYQTMLDPPAQTVPEVQAAQERLAQVPDAEGNVKGNEGGSDAGGSSATDTSDSTSTTTGSDRDEERSRSAEPAEGDPDFNWRAHGNGQRGVILKNGVKVVVDGEQYDKLAAADAIDTSRTPSLKGDEAADERTDESGDGDGGGSSEGSSQSKSGSKNLIANGAEGDGVKVVQKALSELGYDLGKYGVDGYFGGTTEAAVRKLQREHGLKADGKVGRRTQRLLKRLLKHRKDRAESSDVVRSADERVVESAKRERIAALERALEEARLDLALCEIDGDTDGVMRARIVEGIYRDRLAKAQEERDVGEIEESFNPKLHPRDRRGQFRDVLGTLRTAPPRKLDDPTFEPGFGARDAPMKSVPFQPPTRHSNRPKLPGKASPATVPGTDDYRAWLQGGDPTARALLPNESTPTLDTVHRPLRQIERGNGASLSRRRKQDLVNRGLAKWDGPGEVSLTDEGRRMIGGVDYEPSAQPGQKVSNRGQAGTIVRHEGRRGADYYVVLFDGEARSRNMTAKELGLAPSRYTGQKPTGARKIVRESLLDRFDEATADRLAVTTPVEVSVARAAEVALAEQVYDPEATEGLSIQEARAGMLLGYRSEAIRKALAEAECSVPHAKLSRKGIRKCPKCKQKIGDVRKTVEEAIDWHLVEALDTDDHKATIEFFRERQWERLDEFAADFDAAPPLTLAEVSSKAYPGLDRKPGKSNWVDKAGGLPSYIERIAKHLHYEKGKAIGHAIAIAVNVVKKMCASGDTNFPGAQQVNAKSRAQACKAVADWEAKKARSKGKD